MREVSIANRHPRLRLDRRAVVRMFRILDEHQSTIAPRKTGVPSGELSLVFLGSPALAQLHGDFLGDPTSTDVITFPADPAFGVAGEICVSADTAAQYVRQHERDLSAELTLYLVHGWLHLAGYDDRVASAKRAMRLAESRALRTLSRAAAIPQFSLR